MIALPAELSALYAVDPAGDVLGPFAVRCGASTGQAPGSIGVQDPAKADADVVLVVESRAGGFD